MQKAIIAALATTTMLATPAVARDNTWYVGIDGGVMVVEDTNIAVNTGVTTFDDALRLDYETGADFDLRAGYDFGVVRGELEVGYKDADTSVLNYDLPTTLVGLQQAETNGDMNVWSAMVNVLLDFGEDDGWQAAVGGGLGIARISHDVQLTQIDSFDDEDGAFAWQVLAEVRKAISPNLDLGVKYRFFSTGDFDYDGLGLGLEADGLRSHSLLGSLVYNFAAPPPPPPPVIAPPPPPPAPPATQTCPDGSVILATETCPPPPAPPAPPPPPPEPVRG